MFLYLGEARVIYEKDIIGIFDIENTTISRDSRELLKRAEKEGKVENVSFEMPKSYLITAEAGGEGERIYISQISPKTLEKRAGKTYL